MRLSTANVPVAVLSTIPSDSHTWNLVYLHLLLEEHGFRVVNLGACTPIDELVAAHLRHAPDLVVVSTVNGHGAVEGEELIRRLRRHDHTTPVVIGGNLGVAGAADERHVPALRAAGYTGVFVGDRAVRRLPRRTARAGRPSPPGREPGVSRGRFASYVADNQAAGRLVVQPRMGFATTEQMRGGLHAVRAARATTAGTLTLDSFTRVGDHASAARALVHGHDLNGYPLVAHGAVMTRAMLEDIVADDFPVQVRHGSALPLGIFHALLDAGLDATEGGPVSYCLPYSRVPLRAAIDEWAACCELLATVGDDGRGAHLESFAGCMLGQLTPPSLLVALAILEGLFFRRHGVRSMSLSFAQQTNPGQDLDALLALRQLAAEFLPDCDTHLVVYTFMGLFPRTPAGAAAILAESVRLAVAGGAARLIVKTSAEAYRIPTVAENVAALEFAAAPCGRLRPTHPAILRPHRLPGVRGGAAARRGGPRPAPGAGHRTRHGVRHRPARRAVLPAPGEREPGPQPGRARRDAALDPDRPDAAAARHRPRPGPGLGRTDRHARLQPAPLRRLDHRADRAGPEPGPLTGRHR